MWFLLLLPVCTALIPLEVHPRVIPRQKDLNFLTNCTEHDLLYAQVQFNKALGIDQALTWRNASVLYQQIFAKVSQGVDTLVSVCNARQQFVMSLGTTYQSCVNPFTLFAWDSSSVSTPTEFATIYDRLEFMCGGGFDIAAVDYPCISDITKGNDFGMCWAEFLKATTNDVSMAAYCSALNTLSWCAESAVKVTGCTTQLAPWFLCESLRYGNGKICPGLRCYV